MQSSTTAQDTAIKPTTSQKSSEKRSFRRSKQRQTRESLPISHFDACFGVFSSEVGFGYLNPKDRAAGRTSAEESPPNEHDDAIEVGWRSGGTTRSQSVEREDSVVREVTDLVQLRMRLGEINLAGD
jgi:hypothetical protein